MCSVTGHCTRITYSEAYILVEMVHCQDHSLALKQRLFEQILIGHDRCFPLQI